ncbi:MAG: hypothetical protein WB988_04565 [Candidatus Nitrosopolaris sp.]
MEGQYTRICPELGESSPITQTEQSMYEVKTEIIEEQQAVNNIHIHSIQRIEIQKIAVMIF